MHVEYALGFSRGAGAFVVMPMSDGFIHSLIHSFISRACLQSMSSWVQMKTSNESNTRK